MRLKPWVVDVTPAIQEPHLFPPAGRPLSLLQKGSGPLCCSRWPLCIHTQVCFLEQPGALTLKCVSVNSPPQKCADVSWYRGAAGGGQWGVGPACRGEQL